MGHVAAALLIIAVPLAALATVLLPPLAMSRRGASPGAAVLWALALVLLTTWVVSSYRAAVLADETATEGSLLPTVHWLALALTAALASVLVPRRIRSPR